MSNVSLARLEEREDLLNDVWVLETLEQTNFTDGGRGHSVIFFLEPDFFEGHNLASDQVAALVNDTVGSLAQFLLAFVPFQLRGFLDKSLRLGLLRAGLSIHGVASCLHVAMCAF